MIKRKGKIRIATDFFKDEEGLKALKSVFIKFSPIFITEDFTGKIYHGYSEEFDELQDGEPLPFYNVDCNMSITREKEWIYESKFNKL